MKKIMIGDCRILKRKFIKQKEKLVVFIVLLCICSCFFLSSCSVDPSQLFGNWNPQGDWSYDLIGDYSIWRINSRDITLGKYTSDFSCSTVVDSYITCFAYNDRFIAVRRLDVPKEYFQEDIFEMDFEQANWFIVDTQTDEVYGPYFSDEEFQKQCEELPVGELGDWIDTYPAPEGAVF